jgi:hypothetical protein
MNTSRRLAPLVVAFILALSSRGAGADVPRAPDEERWENGFPADPAFFPRAVWVQSPRNADRYKAVGINTYVGLWNGPTDEQLGALERAGMYVICHQNEVGLKNKQRKTIVGWMHGDEPDNAQPRRGGGYGPPILPEKIVADYERMRAADPTRPVLLNLGQGVAWDNWIGRGVRRNHPEDYPQYVKGCDVASFDIYPVTHPSPEVAGNLWYVGRGVERLREWTDRRKPVWACIETTHVSNEKVMPTPRQVRSEVWIALAHGATGIIYFCHEFKPREIEAGLLAHPEIVEAVKSVNAEVAALAPVLNSPTVEGAAGVASSRDDVPIRTLCKTHGGATYVIAVSMRDAPTRGRFTLSGRSGNVRVQVVGEGRSIDAPQGKFEDAFDGYGVHIYRVAE